MTIEDCEQVTRLLSRIYEVKRSTIIVLRWVHRGRSSLRTIAEFQRFIGERVTIRLRQARNSQKRFTGILGEASAEELAAAEAQANDAQNP